MKKNGLATRLASAGILSLALGIPDRQVAQAQRPISLVEDITCVNATSSGRWIVIDRRDISVGRELYTTIMYMYPEAAMTCRLPPSSSATLRLEFGISDNADNGPATRLSIYLDGNENQRLTVSRGQARTVLVDVSNVKSISLETSCTRASGCEDIWFWKAELVPAAASPGAR